MEKIFFNILKFILHPILNIPIIFKIQQKINNYEVLYKEFETYLENKRMLKILEIGCSTGNLSNKIIDMKKNEYIGIDTEENYINYAKKKYKLGNFICMNGISLDFSDNTFDLIIISSVLHHNSDDQAKKIIQESRRVLKKRSFILISEPTFSKNFLSTFLLKLDRGNFIRTFDGYRNLIQNLHIERERNFYFTNHRFVSFVLVK
jgi:ubiquinone/menaquinone biosynthesis C-methylase UbiE